MRYFASRAHTTTILLSSPRTWTRSSTQKGDVSGEWKFHGDTHYGPLSLRQLLSYIKETTTRSVSCTRHIQSHLKGMGPPELESNLYLFLNQKFLHFHLLAAAAFLSAFIFVFCFSNWWILWSNLSFTHSCTTNSLKTGDKTDCASFRSVVKIFNALERKSKRKQSTHAKRNLRKMFHYNRIILINFFVALCFHLLYKREYFIGTFTTEKNCINTREKLR